MRFTNLTGRAEIGANCYLLDIAGKRLVLDCGMHPRLEGTEGLPDFEKLDAVDAVLVSHAHQDHLGALPVLLRRHPNADLFATGPTREIGDVMLHNSVNVMKAIAGERGVSGYPLYTHSEVTAMTKRCQPVPLRQRWGLEGERLGRREEAPLAFEFHDAGHILGSAGILVRGEGRTFFYTGDVNFNDQTLSTAAQFPEEPLDVLVMETTRGDTALDPAFSRAKEEERFLQTLLAGLERGSVLVPVFALGKTQEVLTLLAGLKRGLPVYIGGLSAKITELYDKLAAQTVRRFPKLKLMDAVAPFVIAGDEIDRMPIKPGRVYAFTSGMMTENTLSNVFASRFITDPANSLLFVGYADPESPGGRIRRMQKGDLVQLDERRPAQPLNCAVETFDFSAHACRESLRAWVNRVKPKTIVLTHGDAAAVEWFRGTLAADLPGSRILVPPLGEAVEV